MNTSLIEQNPERAEWNETAPVHRIEPDWAESEWFQVWLQLARLPHEGPPQFELDQPAEFATEERLPLN